MLWMSIVLLSALVLLPCALLLRRNLDGGLRPRAHPRTHRESALALHRAQLDGLERDRADGLIAASEIDGARLEVQRRLLAAAETHPEPTRSGPLANVLLLIAAIPLCAVGLYLIGGHPGLPAQPLAARLRAAEAAGSEDQRLIDQLKAKLATLQAGSPELHQGYLLLGQADAARGDWSGAAAAWRHALDDGFDPTLAAQAAEAQVQADHGVSQESAALFRRALDAGPKDAPWRLLAEQRIAQSEPH